jgi:hypothetical protein
VAKIIAQMPRKWVPNAARSNLESHEAQNTFCPVKALIFKHPGPSTAIVLNHKRGLPEPCTWQIADDPLIEPFRRI